MSTYILESLWLTLRNGIRLLTHVMLCWVNSMTAFCQSKCWLSVFISVIRKCVALNGVQDRALSILHSEMRGSWTLSVLTVHSTLLLHQKAFITAWHLLSSCQLASAYDLTFLLVFFIALLWCLVFFGFVVVCFLFFFFPFDALNPPKLLTWRDYQIYFLS